MDNLLTDEEIVKCNDGLSKIYKEMNPRWFLAKEVSKAQHLKTLTKLKELVRNVEPEPYEEFIAKYGKRPPDICYKIGVLSTRQAIRAALEKEVK